MAYFHRQPLHQHPLCSLVMSIPIFESHFAQLYAKVSAHRYSAHQYMLCAPVKVLALAHVHILPRSGLLIAQYNLLPFELHDLVKETSSRHVLTPSQSLERCVLKSCWSTFSPQSSKRNTTSRWPFAAAEWRAVRPLISPILVLALRASKSNTTCSYPEAAAN